MFYALSFLLFPSTLPSQAPHKGNAELAISPDVHSTIS